MNYKTKSNIFQKREQHCFRLFFCIVTHKIAVSFALFPSNMVVDINNRILQIMVKLITDS